MRTLILTGLIAALAMPAHAYCKNDEWQAKAEAAETSGRVCETMIAATGHDRHKACHAVDWFGFEVLALCIEHRTELVAIGIENGKTDAAAKFAGLRDDLKASYDRADAAKRRVDAVRDVVN